MAEKDLRTLVAQAVMKQHIGLFADAVPTGQAVAAAYAAADDILVLFGEEKGPFVIDMEEEHALYCAREAAAAYALQEQATALGRLRNRARLR